MHPQVLDLALDFDIDGKGCLDQDLDPDVDRMVCLHFEQLEESVLEQSRPSERSGLARKPSRTFRCQDHLLVQTRCSQMPFCPFP